MEYTIISLVAVLALTSIAILLIIFGYRESRLNKRVELLNRLIAKDYENKDIDLNKFIK